MSQLEDIIETVVEALTNGARNQKRTYICAYPDDPDVRSVIHSMLRMSACRRNPNHTLSPCYRSNKPVDCDHDLCPYIIGHSIYFWACKMCNQMRPMELEGCGCSFRHDVDEVKDIRTQTWEYLDRTYGNLNLVLSGPILAIRNVESYYTWLLSSGIAFNHLSGIFAFNINTRKPEFALVYKSDDSIFQGSPIDSSEIEAEVGAEARAGTASVSLEPIVIRDEKFPTLQEVHHVPSLQEVIQPKPVPRKKRAYEVEGI